MRESRKITELEILIARDVVRLADGGKHLGLLDGVDTKIGFQIEVEVEHVRWITRFFRHDFENPLLDGIDDLDGFSHVNCFRGCVGGGGCRCRFHGRYRRCRHRCRLRKPGGWTLVLDSERAFVHLYLRTIVTGRLVEPITP